MTDQITVDAASVSITSNGSYCVRNDAGGTVQLSLAEAVATSKWILNREGYTVQKSTASNTTGQFRREELLAVASQIYAGCIAAGAETIYTSDVINEAAKLIAGVDDHIKSIERLR
jgi:hypothetical protein